MGFDSTKGQRLMDAMRVFAEWEDAGRAESTDDLLDRHQDLRDLLEPLLTDATEAKDATRALTASEPMGGPAPTAAHRSAGTGAVLGGGAYRILRELGRGGMGVVFEAEQVELERTVVLKVLPQRLTDAPGAHARLRREAWMAAKLRHPGIVRVLDIGEEGGEAFVVMEFVDGAPLDRVLARCAEDAERNAQSLARAVLAEQLTPLRSTGEDEEAVLASPTWRGSWRDAVVAIAARLAEALEHAHRSGVVHRDVKPSNILIRPSGEPVLVDFGLAKDEMLPSLTVDGQFAGTPSYVSPEQATAGQVPVDHRTDVFSLGVSLFEMLSLRLPFEGKTHHAILEQILTQEPADLLRFDSSAPADLRGVLSKAMARRADRRYRTAAELAADLRAWMERRPVSARPVSRLQRLGRWAQREPWLAASSLVAVLALLVGGVVSTILYLEAEGQRHVATVRLADVERLADARRLAELLDEARTLWPATPANRQQLVDWVHRAEALAARLPLHEATLQRLRRQAKPLSAAEYARRLAAFGPERERRRLTERAAALDSQLAADPEQWLVTERSRDRLEQYWQEAMAADRAQAKVLAQRVEQAEFVVLPSDEAQWQFDQLRRLVEDLNGKLLAPDRGALADVRERLRRADTVVARSTARFADAWSRTLEEIADKSVRPNYRGLRLAARVGWVPLGRDPHSGWHEFAHVETGALPKRSADGELQVDGSTALVAVLLPGGRVTIGATASAAAADHPRFDVRARGNEAPVQAVELAAFLVGKYEVTRGQWARVVGADSPPVRGDHPAAWPVSHVSQEMALEFALRLGCGLPTDAQWEYAARAGTDTPWWIGSDPAQLNGRANLADRQIASVNAAWLKHDDFDDGFAQLAPVGSFGANPFGLHDTGGNVWEWCADTALQDLRDPVRPDGTGWRLHRGGRCGLRGGAYTSDVNKLRSSFRSGDFPSNQAPDTGFRVVCTWRPQRPPK